MFIVIDLEATGNEPEKSHVIEWAIVRAADILSPPHAVRTAYCAPPVPIPPESSAIHQIIDTDVAGAMLWPAAFVKTLEMMTPAAAITAFVAHQASYERYFVGNLYPGVPWICTYKAAMRVWPDAPGFSNEALRHWLGSPYPPRGRNYLQSPHSAAHDAMVTTGIFAALMQVASVADLVKWANEPTMHPRCPIGKYRGQPWAAVDDGYLDWIIYKAQDMDADIVACARAELGRRFAQEPGPVGL